MNADVAARTKAEQELGDAAGPRSSGEAEGVASTQRHHAFRQFGAGVVGRDLFEPCKSLAKVAS